MLYRKTIAISLLAISMACGSAGIASAAGATDAAASNAAELKAAQDAKLSVADAAQVAETETGGKAMDVSFDDENGQSAYEVEVALNDGSTKQVLVDAQSGKVLNVAVQTEKQNGEHEDSGESNEGDID